MKKHRLLRWGKKETNVKASNYIMERNKREIEWTATQKRYNSRMTNNSTRKCIVREKKRQCNYSITNKNLTLLLKSMLKVNLCLNLYGSYAKFPPEVTDYFNSPSEIILPLATKLQINYDILI